MTKFLWIVLLLNTLPAFSQDNNQIKTGPIIVVDSETHWTYKLDSSHKKLTAYNEYNDSVWTSKVAFPRGGDGSWDCVTSILRIEIRCDTVWVERRKYEGEKLIFIEYEDSCSTGCVAVMNPKTGVFQPRGCG